VCDCNADTETGYKEDTPIAETSHFFTSWLQYRGMIEDLRLVSVSEVVSRISSLLVIPLLTRELQPDGFGIYKSAFLVVSLFLLVHGFLSLEQIVLKHLPERAKNDQAPLIVAVFVVMYSVLVFGLAILFFASGTELFRTHFPEITPWLLEHRPLIAFLFFLIPTFQFTLTLARSLDRFSLFSLAKSVREVLFTVVIAGLFFSTTITPQMALATYGGMTAAGTCILFVGLRDKLSVTADFSGLWTQIREIAVPLLPNRLMKKFGGQVPDIIILSVFGLSTFASWSVLFTFSSLFSLIRQPLTNVLNPKINQRFADDRPIDEYLYQYYRVTVVIAVPATIGGALLGTEIIRYVFGTEYILSQILVAVVLASLSVQVIDALGGTIFVASGKAIYATYTRIISTTLLLVVVAFGAFVLDSLVVVAMAYLLQNLCTLGLDLLYQSTIVDFTTPSPGVVVRLLGSFAVLATVVFVTRPMVTDIVSLVGVVVLGATAYFLSLYVSGFVRSSDIQLVKRLIGV
jgi:O-antigen/teichoic acid export membrane protein